MNKQTSKRAQMPLSILFGVVVSVLLSTVLCAVAAVLVLSEKMGQESIPLLRYAITVISSLAGALIASVMAGKQYLIASSAVSFIYCSALMCLNWMLFEGRLNGLLWTVLASLGSGAGIGFVMAFGQGSGSRKIKKYRFG